MSKRRPIDYDPAVSLWARLAIIEQCSLAIVHRSLRLSEPKRATTRAREAVPHQAGSYSNEIHTPIETEREAVA